MSSLNASCPDCHQIIEAKIMKQHLRISHKRFLPVYYCAVNSCCRSYNSLNSLRNHHKKIHNKLDLPNNLASSYAKKIEVEPIDNSGTEPFDYKKHLVAGNYSNINITEILNKTEVKVKSSISENALRIVADLYGNLNLNRSQAENIIKTMSNDILNGYEMISLKSFILKAVDPIVFNDINKKFNDLQSMFSSLKTEHLFVKHLRELNYFIDPMPVIYGYREELRNEVLDSVKCEGFIIPLTKFLKNFFEMKNILLFTLNYIKKLDSNDKIENIIQTDFWKSKISNQTDLTLPIFIYEDAFESGNPLGSHAGIQSMSAMYLSIPCLPPEFRSQLNNIFFVQIAYTSDIKRFGSKIVYDQVIKQLNTLSSEGIDLEIAETKIKIYFKLALVIGDNLGLNSMLGFITSFNADFFCRFCKISKHMSCQEFNIDNCLLRNKTNYKSDIFENNSQKSGIKEKCAWNNVDGFHVTENYCVDIMHDIFEGVCNYGMGLILYELITVQKLFTLNDLNFKITYFDYPDNVNKPPTITPSQLSNKYIKMSAAEMKNFILHAVLIIADLLPRKNIKHWTLYLLLRQIVCIVLKTEIDDNDINQLDKLVKEHHRLYIQLFGKTLKPKHHFMLHYSTIMKIVGPLVHIWAMRFEAKHQPLKQSGITSMNTINLPKTIAIKQQFCSAQVFFTNDSFRSSVNYEEFEKNFEIELIDIPGINLNNFHHIKSVTIKENNYNAGTVLKLNTTDLPKYARVCNVFREKVEHIDETKISFIIEIFESIKKNYTLQSYELKNTNKYEFVLYQTLYSYKRYKMVTLMDSKTYILYD